MAASKKDPTDPIRLKASRYPGVDEGTSCTQSSFKTGKQAFLYVGMQGGRYKAMFKLQKSKPSAAKLAKKDPDRYQVGSWVTVRFTADSPMPKKIWEKWLDESYTLSLTAGTGKKKKAAKKRATKKKVAKKAKSKTRRS